MSAEAMPDMLPQLLMDGRAPAVALAVGAVFAAGAWAALPRGIGAAAPLSMRRRELRAVLGLAVDNLRELQERAERLTPEEAARERAELEGRAARALSALQALERPDADADAARAQARRRPKDRTLGYLARRPRLQGGLWGLGVGTVVTFLVLGVQQTATVGPAAAPAAAGLAPRAGAAAGPPTAPQIDPKELETLQLTLAHSPDDVPALVRLGHLALQAQRLEEAQKLTDRVLTLVPNNLEAQVHRAVLRAGDGDGEGADAGLQAVLRADPGFAEAWFFRGMLAMQQGQMDRMRESFEQFVKVAPDGPQKERIRAMAARSRTE